MALVASALTSLTSVTTRENRSKLHSPLTAPEVVLLRYSLTFPSAVELNLPDLNSWLAKAATD